MTDTVTVTGSCLCRGVEYEIVGVPTRFYHCHCSRCRKATGTGHASNVMIKLEEGRWTAGEHLVTEYKLAEAERFSTCFCSRCGSPLPRIRRQLGIAVIPAGSLDADPLIKPEARIFWDSRTEWSCGEEELPLFSEYPG